MSLKLRVLVPVFSSFFYEAPMHVYGMQQQIQRRGEDEIVNVSQPNSLYQTIARLERAGLIFAGLVDRESKRPERTIYELTESGRATMVEWTRELLSKRSSEYPEFPAAISVLPVLTPKDALKQLGLRIVAIEAELARLDAKLVAVQFLPRLFRLEIEYLHSQATAELQWVMALTDDLRTERLAWSKASVKKAIKEVIQKHCGESQIP